jgi:putative tryptophan/tyrosine transport system substrate-binding protein
VTITLSRRKFIAALGGTAATWPLATRAQQLAIPVIGYLSAGPSNSFPHLVTAFRQGLSEVGYVEGRNVTIDYRWAEGKYDRLPALAAELVRHNVATIIAVGGTVSALAAKKTTATIPIVFASGGDPINDGLVSSLNRPGGNVTGVTFFGGPLGAKRLELLRQLVPTVDVIGLLVNQANPTSEIESKDVQEAAHAAGQKIQVLNASSGSEVEEAFNTIELRRVGALLVSADTFFTSQRDRLATLAAQYRVPSIYELREFVMAGGLMSYGSSLARGYRQAGEYAGRILKGEQPADLPVVQPTIFELVINLKAAQLLGLKVPQMLLARADEVIE